MRLCANFGGSMNLAPELTPTPMPKAPKAPQETKKKSKSKDFVPMSVRLAPEVAESLKGLAKGSGMTKHYIAAIAVRIGVEALKAEEGLLYKIHLEMLKEKAQRKQEV